jgi:hypothetical protein
MSNIDNIFTFMSACTGHKNTFGHEPFTGRRTVVSDVGLTDSVSHKSIEKGNAVPDITTRQVCDAMLPLLRQTEPCLPRTGIFLDEDDMDKFELDADGTPAKGEPTDSNIMKALSLGTLFYGMLSFSDEEVLFQLHPNKSTWKLKGKEMYGFECAEVFANTFSLRCAMPSCMYRSYFPQVKVGMEGGPAVLPMFVRKGLINEVPEYMRQLSLFLVVQRQGAYPLMCLPCLLLKQIHNRFTERLSFDPDRPQLSPFTVVDLERGSKPEEGDNNPMTTAGITSRPGFTDKYIDRCKRGEAVGWQSDLYEENERSYYMTRLPFGDIEIINDHRDTHNGGYIVRWRDGSSNQ